MLLTASVGTGVGGVRKTFYGGKHPPCGRGRRFPDFHYRVTFASHCLDVFLLKFHVNLTFDLDDVSYITLHTSNVHTNFEHPMIIRS